MTAALIVSTQRRSRRCTKQLCFNGGLKAMMGPGKYDDICTVVQRETGGSVIVIVLDGNKGNGFSCQTTPEILPIIPDLLIQVSKQLRADMEERK